MSITITVKTSKETLKFSLDKGFITIGRNKTNDVVINDSSVSRKHAVLEQNENGFFITDLNSSNGSYVNGQKISGKAEVKESDALIIGRVHVGFSYEDQSMSTIRISKDELGTFSGKEKMDTAAPGTFQPPMPPSPPQAPAPPVPPQAPATEMENDPDKETYGMPGKKMPDIPKAPPSAPAPPPVAPQLNQHIPSQPIYPSSRPRGGQPAGFWIRLAAYLIDMIIIYIPILIINFIMGMIAVAVPSLYMVVMFITFLLNIALSAGFFIFAWSKFGTTPGKKILGMYVIDAKTGRNVTMGKAALRLVGYMISSIILCIGFILIAFDSEKKGLHDKIAGTAVVKR